MPGNSIQTTARPAFARATTIGTIFALLMVTSAVMAQDQPVPGHYEVTTTTTYTDVPVPDTTVTTQNCLTQDDLDRDPASIFAGLPDGKSCEIGEFEMAAGTIRVYVNCSAPDGDMVMITEGTFDNAGYNMLSNVTVTVGEQQVKMQSAIKGKLLGDC
jgi:hypothetical protein